MLLVTQGVRVRELSETNITVANCVLSLGDFVNYQQRVGNGLFSFMTPSEFAGTKLSPASLVAQRVKNLPTMWETWV